MTELEKAYFEILKFLAQSHVRRDINITDGAIKDYCYEIPKELFENAMFVARQEQLIGETSSRLHWQISEKGEKELNRLQIINDLEKNIQATTRNAETTEKLIDISKINLWGMLIFTGVLSVTSITQCRQQSRQNYLIEKQDSLQSEQLREQLRYNTSLQSTGILDTISNTFSKNPTKEN